MRCYTAMRRLHNGLLGESLNTWKGYVKLIIVTMESSDCTGNLARNMNVGVDRAMGELGVPSKEKGPVWTPERAYFTPSNLTVRAQECKMTDVSTIQISPASIRPESLCVLSRTHLGPRESSSNNTGPRSGSAGR